MKFKNTTIVRVNSFVWFIALLFIYTIWWFVAIAEWWARRNREYSQSYIHIVKDAYKAIHNQFKEAFIGVKTGVKVWS